MWKICVQCVAALSLISANAAIPAVKPQSMRGIIFPQVEQYDACYVDEKRTIQGSCKSLGDCPAALERWKMQNIRPQTCYFNKFEQIVCCEPAEPPTIEPDVYMPPPSANRRSETACESYFTFHTEVVHGEPTAPKEFPYMAALGWRSNFDNTVSYRCGGVLISNKYVLTAAHCLELGGEFPSVVRIGGVNLTDVSAADVPIRRTIVHPDYKDSSSYNDIALVELEDEVSETPACVWSEDSLAHGNVTAIGYGQKQFAGVSSDQLLKAKLFIVPNDICQMHYTPDAEILRRGIANNQVCAGDPEHLRDTCQGDSGGPIIMQVSRDTDRNYVIGITSFGRGCAGEPPSIYTRTSAYIDWIENIVWPMTART